MQINPNKLTGSIGTDHARTYGASLGGSEDPENMRKHHMRKYAYGSEKDNDETVQIQLFYDIYDEYDVRTMDGVIPTKNMTLFSPTATSLRKLTNYAGTDKFRTLFKWGDIEYIGFLEKVDFEYSCFSRYGELLKAEATVTLGVDDMVRDPETYEPISPINQLSLKAQGKIKAYTKSEETSMRVALGVSAALR